MVPSPPSRSSSFCTQRPQQGGSRLIFGWAEVWSGRGQVGADPMALSAATVARQNGEATENGLRSMEEEVNWHARAEAAAAACPPAQLLAYQLWVALHCFSVFVDVEGGHQLNAPRDHR
eukprot:2536221-Rhodomonas_salina.1